MIIYNLWQAPGHEHPPIPYMQHTNAAVIRFNLRDYEPPAGASAYVYIETCTGTAAVESATIKTVTIGGIDREQEEISAIEFAPSIDFFSVPGPADMFVRIGMPGAAEYVSFPVPVRIIRNAADATEGGNAINIFDQYLDDLRAAIESAEPIELAVVNEAVCWKRKRDGLDNAGEPGRPYRTERRQGRHRGNRPAR